MNKLRIFQYALLTLAIGPLVGSVLWGTGRAIAQAVNSTGVSTSKGGSTNVTVVTPPNDVVSGPTNLTSAGNVSVSAMGSGSTGIDIRGNATGTTYNFQGSVDGTNYISIPCVVPATGAIVTGATASGTWTCQSAGYQNVRVNMSAIGAGTATITLNASAGSNQPPIGTQGTSTNITAVAGSAVTAGAGATAAGTMRVTLATDSPGVIANGQATMANSQPVVIASNQSAIPVTGTFTPSGTTTVVQPTAANLNATVVGTGTFAVQTSPATSGGLSVYRVQPTASDNHATIKAGAGQVYKISITGNATQTTVQYIRLYDATSGFNGCNSATNLIYHNAIPFGTSGSGILDIWDQGMAFATGISICVTGGYATTDTTSATASALNVNIGYK